jgi:SAM-dependent methyltransferase
MNDTHPISQVEIHTKVREIANSLLKGKVKVIDAAAGNGYMTKWLMEHGAEVTPFDISCSDWKMTDIKCNYSDFNKRIEADDNTFDIGISIETIEHVENPFHFIRELSRVTKPNGLIIITTPNVHSIRSRIKFLFCGLPTLFEYIQDDHMGQHISPVSIGQFLYGFKMANLKLVDIYSTGPKPSFLVSICLSLVNSVTSIGMALLKAQRKSDPEFYLNVLSRDQLRELNGEVSLIVVARKSV